MIDKETLQQYSGKLLSFFSFASFLRQEIVMFKWNRFGSKSTLSSLARVREISFCPPLGIFMVMMTGNAPSNSRNFKTEQPLKLQSTVTVNLRHCFECVAGTSGIAAVCQQDWANGVEHQVTWSGPETEVHIADYRGGNVAKLSVILVAPH